MTAKLANGCLVKVDTGGGVFITVPGVYRISESGARPNLLNVSDHDDVDNFDVHIQGGLDGGNMSLDTHWRPNNAIHQQMRNDNEVGNLVAYKVVYPDSALNTMAAEYWQMEPTRHADHDQPMLCTFNLKREGAATWS